MVSVCWGGCERMGGGVEICVEYTLTHTYRHNSDYQKGFRANMKRIERCFSTGACIKDVNACIDMCVRIHTRVHTYIHLHVYNCNICMHVMCVHMYM